jgi:hypothetical protein
MLDPQSDELIADRWARVIAAIPQHAWTLAEVETAARRAGDHQWELEYALLGVAAPHQPEVMARLVREAEAGNCRAFGALGDVREVPGDSATALAGIASEHLEKQRSQAQSGGYSFGCVDWGWWLAAVNVCHPAAANWPALLEHLTDPLAHFDHLTKPVRLLGQHAGDIPAEVLPQITSAVDQMVLRSKDESDSSLSRFWRRTDFEDAVSWASAALHEITDGIDETWLCALLAGSDAERRVAALLIGLRRDPRHLPALAALASATAPTVRFSAAEALGYWATHDVGGSTAHELIDHLLHQPGTRSARGVIAGLDGKNPRAMTIHEEILRDHRSASVRQRARQLMFAAPASSAAD